MTAPAQLDTRRTERVRYPEVRDRRLATTLAAEDLAEEREGLSPHDRITCRVHKRWAHQCIASPQHVIMVTGHRWCRGCERPMGVAVDELTGSVAVVCARCTTTSESVATRQIVRTCQASLAASRGLRGVLRAA